MDELTKQRLVGASIWLLALVIIVPSWYSNPVNFNPDGVKLEKTSTLPVVPHVYRLPNDEVAAANISADGMRVEVLTAPELAKKNTPVQNETVRSDSEYNSDGIAKQFIDKVSADNQFIGQWIVKLIAVKNSKDANNLANQVKTKYPVYIKFYSKNRVYSLRAGPFKDRVKANKAKQNLDKILRVKSIVMQLK
jgi:DedD protein